MESFVISGARTPIGRYGGARAGVRPDDPAALMVGEAARRAGVGQRTAPLMERV